MTELQKQRKLIIIINVISLLCLLSITITNFAYGIGKSYYLFLILYPLFLVSTILIIAKVRFGIILTLLISIIYCVLLSNEVGRYFVFNSTNYLFWVLVLPYLLFLITIPLTTDYLIGKIKFKNFAILISLITSFVFIIYPVFDRYNKTYTKNIFVDAEINKSGQIKLNCKPGFGDSRVFVLINNSNEFQNQIKKQGEYNQGSYFITNAIFKTNYRFSKLKSITITKINGIKVNPELTWKVDNINGDTDFLIPYY